MILFPRRERERENIFEVLQVQCAAASNAGNRLRKRLSCIKNASAAVAKKYFVSRRKRIVLSEAEKRVWLVSLCHYKSPPAFEEICIFSCCKIRPYLNLSLTLDASPTVACVCVFDVAIRCQYLSVTSSRFKNFVAAGKHWLAAKEIYFYLKGFLAFRFF